MATYLTNATHPRCRLARKGAGYGKFWFVVFLAAALGAYSAAGIPQLPEHHTYEESRLEALPPIPIELDDECAWLTSHGRAHSGAGLDQHEREIQPSDVERLASRANLRLPHSFSRFMSSAELQSRVRSCTDCYLDPGERILETVGSIPGHLVHFLSDSQS